MTLKANTGKTINVVNSAGTTTKYVLGRNDANNTYTWASGVRFIGTGKTDTLNVKNGGVTIDLTNTTLYKSIDAVNASSAASAVTIKGGAQKATITGSAYADNLTGANVAGSIVNGGAGNDIIKAGTKGNVINGGAGNDTITLGAGTDTVLIASGMGTDTVTGFSASDRIKISSGTMTSIAAASTGTSVVVTAGTGKAVIKAGTGKVIQIINSSGIITKYWVGRNDMANTFTWVSDRNYIGGAKKDTLNITTGGANVNLLNSKSIEAVSATKANKAVTITGGAFVSNITGSAYGDTIKAGSKGDTIRASKGNDKIYAGAGTDVIQYAKGDGADIIYNLSASDKIKFVSDSLKSIAAASSGTDVIITTAGGGKLTLKGNTGKTINVVNSSGTTTKYAIGRKDANTSYTWASGVRYIGSSKTDTLNVNTAGGTIDLTNTTYYKSIDAVNASKATKAVTIKGGAQYATLTGSNYNDVIKAGSKGGTITGGKGNDNITAGAGVDVIVIADGMGTDTITGFSAADKVKVTSSQYTLGASKSDVIVTAGKGKAVIKSGLGKIIQVVDNKGVVNKYEVGKEDTANTFTWSSGMNYVGGSKNDTLKVKVGGANVDLTKSVSIDVVDASAATKGVKIKGGSTKSTITGTDYADTIIGDNAGGTVKGGAGNDTITGGNNGGSLYGGAGSDIIKAGNGGNVIDGGAGNDTITAGAGVDTIMMCSGMGTDTVTGFSSADFLKIDNSFGSVSEIYANDTGTDVVASYKGTVILKSMTGKLIQTTNCRGEIYKYVVGRNDMDNAFTWSSGVRFIGGKKKDTLNVNGLGGKIDLTSKTLYTSIDAVDASKSTEAVTVYGGADYVDITATAYDDTIEGGTAGGTINAGAGNDIIEAGRNGHVIDGGAGDDKITLNSGDDTVVIGSSMGYDIVNYFSENDSVKISSGTMTDISASGYDVTITVGNGKAVFKSTTGKIIKIVNTLGELNKYVVGKSGSNNSYAWQSNTHYVGSSERDTLNVNTAGGTIDLTNTAFYKSIDVVNARYATAAVNIKGGANTVTITGSDYSDTLTGDNAGGTVNGGAGNDTIIGGLNGGTLDGGAGSDTIKAGKNGNVIIGGAGNDIITAGAGVDTIVMTSGMDTDTVTGFSSSDFLKIDSNFGTLSDIYAKDTGTDVVAVASSKGTVILKSMAGKVIQTTNSNGSIYKYIVGRNDMDNTFTWSSGVSFIGGKKKDTLKVTGLGGTIDLTKSGYVSIDEVNASGASEAVTIYGSSEAVTLTGSSYDDTITGGSGGGNINGGAGNDTIKAGRNGNVIDGGKGDDKITLGSGADTVVWSIINGNDTVYYFNADNDTLKISNYGYALKYTKDGSDIVVTNSYNSSTLRFKSSSSSDKLITYLSSLGVKSSSSYQSSLGCIAASVQNDTPAPSVMSYTEYQPLAGVADGTLAAGTSELSSLQKQYVQY